MTKSGLYKILCIIPKTYPNKIKNYRPTRDICAIYRKKSDKSLKDFVSIIKKVLNN